MRYFKMIDCIAAISRDKIFIVSDLHTDCLDKSTDGWGYTIIPLVWDKATEEEFERMLYRRVNDSRNDMTAISYYKEKRTIGLPHRVSDYEKRVQ